MLPLPHDARAPRAYLAALAAWLVAALVLAWLRVPYDDEWFSIDAAALSHPELLRTLARDLHPPWVAHLDWVIAHATSERLALHLPRLAASALAIHLLSQTLGRRTALGPTLVALACFHPLVLFYGGAIRWYPFVFLAQAARLWALWSTAPAPRRDLAFVLGGLGPAAGYIDGLFLLHDCVWWVARGRTRRATATAALALGLGGVAVAGGAVLLGQGIPVGAGMHPSLLDLLTWLGIGLVGPAHPEWPWWIAAVLVPVAMIVGWRYLWRTERPGPLGWWLVTTMTVWAAAAAVMFVWSPRYSLLLWPIATLGIVRLAARHRGPPRILGLAAVGYLAVVTAHVYAGTGSLKSDLDDLDPTVCAELAHADLVLADYPRTQELLVRRCEPGPPIVRLPHSRHTRTDEALVAPLRPHLTRPQRLLHLYPMRRSGSLERTWRAARAELARHCTLVESRSLGTVAHKPIRDVLTVRRGAERFGADSWRCEPAQPSETARH